MAHIFTPALRRPLSKPFAKSGTRTLIQRAIASLRARGTDAHLWLPGGDVRTYGPELVTNRGPFVDTTGWVASNATISAVDGKLRVTENGVASAGYARQSFSVISGRTYSIGVNVSSVAASKGQVWVGSAYGSGNWLIINNITSPAYVTNTFVATTNTAYIEMVISSTAGGTTEYVEISSISVREITSITSAITNGLTTGNYLESTGNTLGTVDNPCGLVLDALGSVSATELVTNGGFDSATGWTYALAGTSTASISGGVATITKGDSYAFIDQSLLVENKVYECTLDIVSITGTASLKNGAAVAYATFTSAGQKTFRFRHSVVDGNAYLSADSGTVVFDNISVREVSGIHLTQGTTANKGLLKQDSGSRYYWLFDATDLLTGTFPAGYESVTVIDAKSTGQATTSAANVVGSYSIGPSYSSYGRIIIKGSITASELALYQGFANRLAGL